MLSSLSIRDIVLIEAIDLEFHPGLNILTGETGAGKSILLDALGFALGRKVRRDLVRAGSARASVTAEFELGDGHPAFRILEELEVSPDGGALVLRRVGTADGPTRGFVNDQRVSAEALRRIGEALVEVHGQHDDRGLLNPRAHRPLLDTFAGLDLAGVRAAWRRQQDAATALDAAGERIRRAAEDAEFLRHSATELEKLAPAAGEDAALDAERRLIKQGEKIRDEIAEAARLLSPEAAEGLLGDALSRLSHVAERAEGRLDEPIEALDRAMAELGAVQTGVEDVLRALAFDPGRLDEVEERLFALRALARKHAVQPDDLASLAGEFGRRLEEIEAGEERIADLERTICEAEVGYRAAAAKAARARQAAAVKLDKAVTRELAPLKMETARFRTELTAAKPGPDCIDEVSFTATINPGAPAGPIDKIASGGELSRFLLALKVCLATRTSGRAMIFDEIDRGVGGATADAVGRRLARLAEGGQVLVVTHSPQVAALGAHHWQIAKTSDGTLTRTDVAPLDRTDRLDEIARMLAGDVITPEARDAARALLENAG